MEMVRHKKQRLILTERDHQLFEFLFKGKVSNLEQLRKLFFDGKSLQVTDNV